MPKGEEFIMKPQLHRDDSTGAEVIRLTSGDSAYNHPYFFYDPWVDNDRLAFYSNRNGTYNLYLLDTSTGRCIQLTDSKAGGGYCGLLHGEILLVRGPKMFSLDPETLKEELLVDIGSGRMDCPRLSGDSEKIIFQRYDKGLEGSGACTVNVDGTDYIEHFTLREEYCYLQFCPSDNNLATLARISTGRPDASDEERSRIWRVSLDDPVLEPFYVPPHGKKVTHEYWDGPGERMFFQQYTYQTLVPSSVCCVGKDGRSGFNKFVESESINFCHSHIGPDNRLVVSDQLSDKPNSIYIVSLKERAFEELCRADTTWENQRTHAHPRFDSCGESVIFTSTRTGSSQIYRVYL